MLSVIYYSDEIHIINFTGDKKAYTIYITSGNLHSDILTRSSQMTLILLALLPVKTWLQGTSTAADKTH